MIFWLFKTFWLFFWFSAFLAPKFGWILSNSFPLLCRWILIPGTTSLIGRPEVWPSHEMDVEVRGVSLSEAELRCCYPKEGRVGVRQAETTDECHNIHDIRLRKKRCEMTSGVARYWQDRPRGEAVLWGTIAPFIRCEDFSDVLGSEGQRAELSFCYACRSNLTVTYHALVFLWKCLILFSKLHRLPIPVQDTHIHCDVYTFLFTSNTEGS